MDLLRSVWQMAFTLPVSEAIPLGPVWQRCLDRTGGLVSILHDPIGMNLLVVAVLEHHGRPAVGPHHFTKAIREFYLAATIDVESFHTAVRDALFAQLRVPIFGVFALQPIRTMESFITSTCRWNCRARLAATGASPTTQRRAPAFLNRFRLFSLLNLLPRTPQVAFEFLVPPSKVANLPRQAIRGELPSPFFLLHLLLQSLVLLPQSAILLLQGPLLRQLLSLTFQALRKAPLLPSQGHPLRFKFGMQRTLLHLDLMPQLLPLSQKVSLRLLRLGLQLLQRFVLAFVLPDLLFQNLGARIHLCLCGGTRRYRSLLRDIRGTVQAVRVAVLLPAGSPVQRR
mmetsp:Transcript_14300/g.38912  ORF Transcript_14300/g.38912 Transcript_14300/m.38912 type:complete len:341 (+) Transcript_14300:508-1530(+)